MNIFLLPDRPSFPLGELYMTAGVNREIDPSDVWKALERHSQRDWGDVCEEDKGTNDLSLTNGTRLLSVYHDRKGVKFWVITEADRSMTTVLLPDDY